MMICPEYLEEGVEKVFREIHHSRMRGMPVLNNRLEVQAVGFRNWEGQCLGVLITPWFINLMLIPQEGDAWEEEKVGKKIHHHFPSGHYEFIVGEEEGIGRYQMCSLFSPVFQFEDQAAAVATAKAALEALMDEENHDDSGFDEQEVARRWRGDSKPESESQKSVDDAEPKGEDETERGISRRAFISAGLSQKTG